MLGQIWSVTDREARGSLNQTEFVVAMHLLASMRSGNMKTLPQTLPQGLWDAAARRVMPVQATGIPRQLTGQGAPQRTQSPLARQAVTFAPLPSQSTGGDWLITPQDKARFDSQFATLDRERRGYITGDQAVSFFSNSGLSEDALATIWDLSDINSEGQLNRDEFAVAMYLIRQERSKTTGRGNLPATLPPRLVPPSMRKQTIAPSQPTAPVFDNVANAPAAPKSAADDLFGLDALSEEPKPQQASAQDPFGNDRSSSPASPPPPSSAPLLQSRAPVAASTQFKPFQPTSSFGQGLTSQTTGGSIGSNQSSARGAPQPAGGHDDLLGDTDPEINKRFNPDTTELANMSNQVGTLRNQMQETQSKKVAQERDLAATASQKQELQTRLAQFRTQYEQEVREVKSLEERLTASRNETKRLQQEFAMLEGTHADLNNQHQQLSQALEIDQRENAQLKERTSQINAEVAQLRPVLEKLRNDARQQKGMVAINKKQLSTSEGERDKLNGEKDDLEKEISESRAQNPEVNRGTSSGFASPANSVNSPPISAAGQSMNPFFRKSSTQSMDRPGSVTSPRQDYNSTPGAGAAAFESFFGPSDPVHTPGPPPPTTFSNASQPNIGETSREITTPMSGLRTPPPLEVTSPATGTPRAVEPPAPPESRQITSSALPFRPEHLRTDSPASASVKVNPPASRSGFSDAGGIPTPGGSSVATSVNGDELPSGPGTQSVATAPENKFATSKSGNNGSHLIPGSFPGELDSPTRSTPTAGSVTSLTEHATTAPAQQTGTTSTQIAQAQSVDDDFESAFAGANLQNASDAEARDPFAPTSSATKGKSRADSEFPPIQDVEPDESDSESERESEHGFGDDFGSAAKSPTQHIPTADARTNTLAVERPPLEQAESTASMLPGLNAQQSPPTYESTEGATPQESTHFPKQYEGLLPQRQASNGSPETILQSPLPSVSGAVTQRSGSLANHDTFPVSSELKQVASEVPDKTGGHDEFDTAFDDLDEAKEDDQNDATFGINSETQHKDDFDFSNPQFTSPATTSRANTFSSSIRHTPSGSTQPTTVTNVRSSTESHPFGSDAFGASSTSNSALPASMSSQSHDWDAIFSGLDKPVSETVAPNGPVIPGRSPFAPTETTASSVEPASAPTRGLSPPTNDRPAVARAISAGTEHDDPILKSLTGMGYPREKALEALEKYDYNLDKVSESVIMLR